MCTSNWPYQLKGSIPALPTPFAESHLDIDAFKAILSHALAGGSSAIVVAGSTGEGSSLEIDEYRKLVECAAKNSTGTPIIAGVGAVSTDKAIHLSRTAKLAGADGLLVVTPYYTRPSHEGIFLHFAAIAKATSLPIILYNVPPRTGYNIPSDVLIQLYMEGHIIGLKECMENLNRIETLISSTGKNFSIFCGDDEATIDMLHKGAAGCISVVANVLPKHCAAVHKHWALGEAHEASACFSKLKPLIQALMLEPNPQGVKHALSMLGLCTPELRLPLLPVKKLTAREIEKAIDNIHAL